MQLYELRKGEHLVLRPVGRLDSTTSGAMEHEITARIEAGDHRIVIDFRDLDYISSAGLRVLLLAAKQIQQHDGSLALCNLNDNVTEVFDISGFSGIFSIHESIEGAVSES